MNRRSFLQRASITAAGFGILRGVEACATTPVPPRTERLFRDQLFAIQPERISADDVFAFSNDMKQYLSTHIASQFRTKDRQRALLDALYSNKQLKLAYDAEMTKFSARHELQAATWTQRVLNRMGPLKSMNGRERMRAALAKLGFEIR